jgi:hypothetical protein
MRIVEISIAWAITANANPIRPRRPLARRSARAARWLESGAPERLQEEHDDNHQIVGTLVEDLWLPSGDIDPARTGVEEGPDLAHYAVLNARNGTSFRYAFYKKDARTEERRSRVTIPFARSSDAKAFVKALARPTR